VVAPPLSTNVNEKLNPHSGVEDRDKEGNFFMRAKRIIN
jgi:hypothetical protein